MENSPKIAFLKALDNSVYRRLDTISETKGIDANNLLTHFQRHNADLRQNSTQEMYLAYRKVQLPRIPLFASTS